MFDHDMFFQDYNFKIATRLELLENEGHFQH